MEVIMSSPVNEPTMMENAESNGAVELTKTQKKNQRRKLKLKQLKSLAKNPENNQQLDQSNPNNSLSTTATVDLKLEVSSPAADDTNTCPQTELHMITHSEKMISDNNIATSDANTVSKGEADTKVTIGEIGSSTPAIDHTLSKGEEETKAANGEIINTVSKKRKNPESSDIQSVDKSTKTQDMASESSRMENDGSSGAVELTKSQKLNRRKKRRLEELKSYVKDLENKLQVVQKKQEESSPATTGADTQPEVEIQMVTNSEKMISDINIATSDANTVSKGEEDTKVAINAEKASMDIQSVNESTHTRGIVTVINKDSSTTATNDAKVVVNEVDSKVTNGEIGSDTTATDNTVPKGVDETKVINGEIASGTTATDSTVSKKKRRPKQMKKKNPESKDIQGVDESAQTHEIVTVINKDSSTTANDDVKVVVKGVDDRKVTNGETGSGTPATDNTVSKKRKNPASSDIQSFDESTQTKDMVNVKKDSSATATSDANTELKGEEDTKATNFEIGYGTTPTDSTVSKKKSRQKRKEKKNPEAMDIQRVDESTQTHDIVTVVNKDSSTTTNDDVKLVVNGEVDTKITNGEMGSGVPATDNIETSDAKKVTNDEIVLGTPATENTVSKGKVTNGETGSGTPVTDNTLSKKRKNPESSDIQSGDESKQTQDMVTVKKDSSETSVMENDESNGAVQLTRKQRKNLKERQELKLLMAYVKDLENKQKLDQNKHAESSPATTGANTVSKEEDDTKVANGEICPVVPVSTVSKKRKNPEPSDIQCDDENKDSSEASMLENDGSNSAVKVTKKQGKHAKRKEKLKFLRSYVKTLENQQQLDQNNPNNSENMISDKVEISDDANTVSQVKDDTKPTTNGEMSSGTPATDETVSKKSKKKKKKKNPESIDIQSVHDSTQTQNIVTNDVKVVVKGEKQPKVTNQKKMVLSKATNFHRSNNNRPTIGEILNPQYLELTAPRYIEKPETNEENSELPKEISKKRKRDEVKPVDLDINGQTEVKPRDDQITRATTLRRKLLIFDINGLLADIVSPRPQDIIADYYIPKRAIFKRPFLEDFMRFCFERFDVAIWSSRTKHVLYPVIDFIFGDLKKNLLFVWDNSSCTHTGMNTIENSHKPMVFKDLRKIWGPGNSWAKGDFHESNTLLVDDSPYKALLNPKNTAIFPQTYSYKNRNDDSLGPNGELRKYLEGLAESENVKKYVEQHPFKGQVPIDETHRYWAFYSKALDSKKKYMRNRQPA